MRDTRAIIGYLKTGPVWLHSGARIIAGPDDGADPDAPDADDSPDDDDADPDDADDSPDDADDADDDDADDDGGDIPTGDEWYEARSRLRRTLNQVRSRGGNPEAEKLTWDGDDQYPPTAAEWAKMQQLLRDATRRSMALKAKARAQKPAPPADDTDTGSDPDTAKYQAALEKAAERAATRAAANAESKLKPVLVREAVKAGLAVAGWAGAGGGGMGADPEKRDQSLSKVMKFIDIDKVEIDEQGNLTGVDEQIAELKEEFPEWFRRRTTTPTTQNVDGGGRRRAPAPKPRTWAEQVDSRFAGGRRRT
jgi:hypothetical protein